LRTDFSSKETCQEQENPKNYSGQNDGEKFGFCNFGPKLRLLLPFSMESFKLVISIWFLALATAFFFSFKEVEKGYKLKTIVLDAGHGGKDPGTHGKKTKEKEVTLSVILKLGKLLKTKYPEMKIMYTRMKDNFVELHERANIANRNNADLFISIHCNSGPSHVQGSETYAMGLHTSEGNLKVAKRENAVILKEDNYLKKYEGFDPNSPLAHIFFANVQNAYLDQSLSFAQKVEQQFENLAGKQSRGVKQAGFLVLWKTAMPSVLIELGYLTHSKEEKMLAGEDGQDQAAKAILKAVQKFKEEVE
jgi:N-acetylmuramoyl-L-alanine amidase